jgi:hypothetical protein
MSRVPSPGRVPQTGELNEALHESEAHCKAAKLMLLYFTKYFEIRMLM